VRFQWYWIFLRLQGARSIRLCPQPQLLSTATANCRMTTAKSVSSRRKRELGSRAVILGHHYQRADVYKHADLTGYSAKAFSKLFGEHRLPSTSCFCGVHFMAEVADIMGKPGQGGRTCRTWRRVVPWRTWPACRKVEARAWREIVRKCSIRTRKSRPVHLHQFRRRSQGRSAANTVASSVRRPMPGKILDWSFCTPRESAVLPGPASGPLGAGTRWEFPWSRCRYGIRMSRWAA